MEHEKKITVSYRVLADALTEEYKEEFDIIELCFDDYVNNDTYVRYYFDGKETYEEDEYCSAEKARKLNLIDRFLYKEFPDEEYILIEIYW